MCFLGLRELCSVERSLGCFLFPGTVSCPWCWLLLGESRMEELGTLA